MAAAAQPLCSLGSADDCLSQVGRVCGGHSWIWANRGTGMVALSVPAEHRAAAMPTTDASQFRPQGGASPFVRPKPKVPRVVVPVQSWSAAEDAALRAVVERDGPKNW